MCREGITHDHQPAANQTLDGMDRQHILSLSVSSRYRMLHAALKERTPVLLATRNSPGQSTDL